MIESSESEDKGELGAGRGRFLITATGPGAVREVETIGGLRVGCETEGGIATGTGAGIIGRRTKGAGTGGRRAGRVRVWGGSAGGVEYSVKLREGAEKCR